MCSFGRLRHSWNHSVCVHSIENGRHPVAKADGRGRAARACRTLAGFCATLTLILAPMLMMAAAARAQDADSAPPAPAAGQSDSNPGQTGQGQTGQDQAGQDQAGQNQTGQAAQETAGQISVQERIRQRRAQRRATAIHDAYDHLFESYAGMGYLRFQPGASLQRTTFYGWNTGLTRYYNERFGVDLDARGYYGIAYTGEIQGISNATNTRPKISEYNVLLGPTYRFYVQPKFSVAGRALGGFALGDFSGDTNGFGSKAFGIWPDGITYAGAGSLIGQFNVSPGLSVQLTGEDFVTGFGSTIQNSFGFTGGLVYRFGKQ
jgi:hypothetical protein